MIAHPIPQAVDFILVGGGKAGCLLANRLAEGSEASFLVLESGKDLTDEPWITDLNALRGQFKSEELTWQLDSVSQEYGETAFKRDNVSLVTEATATKILLNPLEPGPLTATGVEVSFNGKTHSIAARKEVIISAGTFHTPKLLELSGIGGRSLLDSLEIPVVIESPGVGQNVQNHLMSVVSFELNEGIAIGEGGQTISLLALPDRQQQQDLFNEHEPVEPESKVSYEIVRKIFADKTEASASFLLAFMGMPNFATLVLMQTLPISRESCHIHSKDTNQSPRIDPNFFSNP
ncbi:MAG: hypothetical protein OHK93_005472 [Ramalina farinacea]|uniref:Glucose-methanol-choline oxidoreductase N-terminal domain-containing protein n=1 Tax=Ramalina farinacea TaxID=258253 RepID=A0AA43QGQ5_9LECA|nr:hypothetical protein [Ramalina farinacea]